MGKSAKLHKRVKKVKSGASSTASAAAVASTPQAQAQAAKKKSTLKGKNAKSGSGSSKNGLLGGADYVELMMGSRKKARCHALYRCTRPSPTQVLSATVAYPPADPLIATHFGRSTCYISPGPACSYLWDRNGGFPETSLDLTADRRHVPLYLSTA
ncbi:hypothetical protein LshimejAT787_0501010 [Lyophyllum shimeji]|uniref:Uncharacterized protein n=1 Tax=Lyophyllum shimeji TaxID=47721 RepID=A0A9P3PMX3_LYOSH|nr:hypothetical protein LshimejAT787_0501010 [Lyophyllum shimeji]